MVCDKTRRKSQKRLAMGCFLWRWRTSAGTLTAFIDATRRTRRSRLHTRCAKQHWAFEFLDEFRNIYGLVF